MYYAIECESCRSVFPVVAEEVINEKKNHVCLVCHSKKELISGVNLHARKHPWLSLPEGIDALPIKDRLELRIHWRKSAPKAKTIFLTLFTTVWVVSVIGALMMAGHSGDNFGMLFLGFHLLAAVVLVYSTLSQWFNYTEYILDAESISIATLPFTNPLKSSRRYKSENIDQLFVIREITGRTEKGQPIYATSLYLQFKNGSKTRLAQDLGVTSMKYLEQEIERYYHVQDR